jgi:hypothetical protein
MAIDNWIYELPVTTLATFHSTHLSYAHARADVCSDLNNYTVCFIMFSVITNIYNKKTKGPTLMEFFTATGKLRKVFFTTRDVRCVHHGWHGTHQYDIQVLATHTHINMVTHMWQEHEYRIDVCHVTCGAHIEHL